jgi:hypothetical protein
MKASFDLVNSDKLNSANQRDRDERNTREHERQQRRYVYRERGNATPSLQGLCDCINNGRRRDVDRGKTLHFESEVRAHSRHRGHGESGAKRREQANDRS